MRKFATIYLSKSMSTFEVDRRIAAATNSFGSENRRLCELISIAYSPMFDEGVYYATIIVEAGPQLPKVV